MNAGAENYNKVKLIEKTENSVILQVSIPEASHYFDGHFPGFPVLPGVAQVDLVVCFAEEHFGITVDISKINRVKFANLIRPDDPIVLFIKSEKGNIVFKITSPGGETVYSSGTMTMRNCINN